MTNEKLTLQDIAQRASSRNGGAKGRALDRIAKQRGLSLSYTTVDKILQGKYTSRPGGATLLALSALSDIPLDEVFAAAGQALPQARLADQLPPEVDRLTPEQRRVVIDLARVFVRQNRELEALKGRDGNVSTAPITQAGESPAVAERNDREDLGVQLAREVLSEHHAKEEAAFQADKQAADSPTGDEYFGVVLKEQHAAEAAAEQSGVPRRQRTSGRTQTTST